MARPPNVLEPDAVGFRVRSLRKKKSQVAFAVDLGLSRGYLAQIERGELQPSRQFIAALKNLFPDLSIDWLLTGRGASTVSDDVRGGPVDVGDEEFTDEFAGLEILGEVAAGVVSLAVEDRQVVAGDSGVWALSVFRKQTRGGVVYLRVRGNSMEPDFPEGCLLACARPGGAIGDLTPVVVRVGDEATFKLYKLGKDRLGNDEVELWPVNRSFYPQRFAPGEVVVDFVVLGFINPWIRGVVRERAREARVGVELLLRDVEI